MCQLCNLPLYNKSELAAHIRTVHEPPKFICYHCGKGCGDQTRLEVHIEAVHIKSGKLKCEFCTATYNTKTALTYHVKTTHSDERSPYANFVGKCQCGVEFLSKASLLQHLKTSHKLADGCWHCFSCARKYTSGVRLRIHFERFHKIQCVDHSRWPKKKE